jgi:RNA polymerase sigma factor for flagellar operon FliA
MKAKTQKPTSDYLSKVLGREPTNEELIKALGYKPDEFYSDLQKISASYLLSLDDLRENLVLQLILYEEIPAKEVAKLLKVSTARVSQIKESALSKLREKLKDMV